MPKPSMRDALMTAASKILTRPLIGMSFNTILPEAVRANFEEANALEARARSRISVIDYGIGNIFSSPSNKMINEPKRTMRHVVYLGRKRLARAKRSLSPTV